MRGLKYLTDGHRANALVRRRDFVARISDNRDFPSAIRDYCQDVYGDIMDAMRVLVPVQAPRS